MTQFYTSFTTSLYSNLFCKTLRTITGIILVILLVAQSANAQAVSGIVTDYNGYWKSSVGAVNTVKPENSHNLLSFSFNGSTYSTGVNDALLTAQGEAFTPNDFWSLPVASISGTLTNETKVGLGEKYDGVTNGASNPPPAYDIAGYLTDGIKGLNIGTCIANLPAGYLTFPINHIKPGSIGDGIPDILVTQVADPSSTYDRYTFTDANGVQVGNYKDIVLTSITPVGSWTADFYEAKNNPLVLTSGYTKTDRSLRLWAADLSEFGITLANYQSVRYFRIGLSGTSDVAFIAYSARSIALTSVLPVSLTDFTAKKVNGSTQLKWTTASESNTAFHVIERSINNKAFTAIDSVKAAGNSATERAYVYTDKQSSSGTTYYRIKTVDADGRTAYSSIVAVKAENAAEIFSVQPNPASNSSVITVSHDLADGKGSLMVYNAAGHLLSQQTITKGSIQTNMALQHFTKGIHYIVLQDADGKKTKKLLIN